MTEEERKRISKKIQEIKEKLMIKFGKHGVQRSKWGRASLSNEFSSSLDKKTGLAHEFCLTVEDIKEFFYTVGKKIASTLISAVR